MDLIIRRMKKEHWDQVKAIYLEGIKTGNATFQTDVPTSDSWAKGHIPNCSFIAVLGDEIVGWAALSPVSDTCIYAGVAEVSVYVGQNYKDKGIGKTLLEQLIKESEKNGIWTLQAGIFPENIASLNLHTKMGFREVGIRERIGKMHGKWRDIVLIERRSRVTGND